MEIILDTQFKDFEHFVEEIQYWDLDFRLLGTGGFKGSLKQLLSPKVLLTYARLNRGVDQVGSTPPGFKTFVIIGQSCNGFRWRHHQVNQNDLLIFPNSSELHAVSSADFEVFTVSIHMDYIEQLINVFGLCAISNKQEIVHMDELRARELRWTVTSIFRSTNRKTTQDLTLKLAEQIVLTSAQFSSQTIIKSRKRDIAVDKVVEFVRNTSCPTSELAQLCRIANVSARTLQYAFKERYGLAPSTFVKRWNLNTARRQLRIAYPEETTINKISMDLNFTHQSQFAAAYKHLFSELPSETLKNTGRF
jgi:AraC family transcriptional regulator, ethanolamine operon transcriptional activator